MICRKCEIDKPPEDYYHWTKACKECVKARNKAWNKANPRPHHRKMWRIKRYYGIEPEEFAMLVQFQNGVCAICSKLPDNKPLQIDHDHRLPRGRESVRGLLCHKCNLLLGLCEDNDEILEKAIEYLWSYRDPL